MLATFGFSCTQQLQRRYDQRHGTSTYKSSDYDSDRSTNTDYRSGSETYRKDYDKVSDGTSTGSYAISASPGSADYNQQMIGLYQEMDKLGEVVVYELDILESRRNVLLNEYKSAKSSQKQVIGDQLDRISDDQMALYKAYTNIYRNGKSNWTTVKRDVEQVLRSVRRVPER